MPIARPAPDVVLAEATYAGTSGSTALMLKEDESKLVSYGWPRLKELNALLALARQLGYEVIEEEESGSEVPASHYDRGADCTVYTWWLAQVDGKEGAPDVA